MGRFQFPPFLRSNVVELRTPLLALTPRVRILAICDGIRESTAEAGVFYLKGVRQAITGRSVFAESQDFFGYERAPDVV
jgi:hypothetical protein